VNRAPTIGVLALQGAFASHVRAFADLDVATREIRTREHLDGVDALVIPGGESTTIGTLLVTTGLHASISDRLAAGMPVFGTCAGMILLATDVLDGRSDQIGFGALDVSVRRNGYGRQVDSFETDVAVDGLDRPFHAVFIRAPKVESVGAGVTVVASHDGVPVLVRRDHVMAASFHPELTDDTRLHQLFLTLVGAARRAA
jgi:5'-phosphate synthase pdxT subunit